jgi:tRNA (guanine37-N1)-methyltransferase
VPDVLLSGHHANIAAWRRDQAMRRTATRRPDLLHSSQLLQANDETLAVVRAVPADAAELLVLQRCCWLAEAQANETLDVPALQEDLDDVRRDIDRWDTYVVRAAGRLVASVRGRREGDVWAIGRLMVAPDLEGRGLGRRLLAFIEAAAPETATSYELFTGSGSVDNLRMYRKAGYRILARDQLAPGVVTLGKRRR